jgi:hypothetical protein
VSGVRANIAVVQLAAGGALGGRYRDLVAPALERNRVYCERQGYDYVLETDTSHLKPDTFRHPSWYKIPLLLRYMQRYRWTLCLDADAAMVRPDVRLEALLDDDFDVLTAADRPHAVAKGEPLNCGLLAVRNTPWARRFLDLVWEDPRWRENPLWEQDTINRFYREDTMDARRHLRALPETLVAMSDMHNRGGAVIVHFSGLSHKDLRLRMMKELSLSDT